MRIRAAKADDAARCAEIYRPYVTDSWISFEAEPPSEKEMASRIRAHLASHAWLVAEDELGVVGYAYAAPHRAREAYKKSCDVAVYVGHGAQHTGAGSALYQELLPLLAQTHHAAFAGIALPNVASVQFHEKFGFQSIGIYREVGFKLGEWRDVGWWQLLL